MSWEIIYWDEEISTPIGLISAQADEKARAIGYEEGCSGLSSPIRFLNKEFKDRDEAMEYIQNAHRQYYCRDVDCNIAVKYRSYPKITPSKTLEGLKARLDAEKTKRVEYARKHSVSTFKAEYVGCPKCGSKLKRGLLQGETCPLCRSDLRGMTTLETLKRYEANILDLEKKIKEEEKKLQEKMISKSTWRWLIKFSCHS